MLSFHSLSLERQSLYHSWSLMACDCLPSCTVSAQRVLALPSPSSLPQWTEVGSVVTKVTDELTQRIWGPRL